MSLLRRIINAVRDVEQPSTPGGASETARIVENANRWREQYNPLRGLTFPIAVSWMEQCQRGIFADFQWACHFIERRDADLYAIIERRCGMLTQMDWDIKTVERRFKQRGMQYDSVLASEQQAALRGSYDRFENLYEAIEHLAMASFWGYAPVQYIASGELLKRLNCLDPWNVCRDGAYGDWYWNPEAFNREARSLPSENRLDLNAYVFRTQRRMINEIALIKYLRQNLSAKDWDAFLEIYGVPGWIVIMPQNVPAGKESEYEDAASAVAAGRSGALPFGSDAKCADAPRGVVPFRDHLEYWSQRLVLAGTGGLLTMLSAPGSGTLAGGAHWEAFQIIARSEARKISELLQRSIDKHILSEAFKGQPALAYFELAANEEQDVGDILDHAIKIYQAGGQVDWTQISEKTGYKVSQAAPRQPMLQNRLRNTASVSESDASLRSAALGNLSEALTDDFRPLADRLRGILELEDPALINSALRSLRADIPSIARTLLSNPRQASVLEKTITAALFNGYAEGIAAHESPDDQHETRRNA